MIFGIILPILSCLILLKTAFTDPGIIPRNDSIYRGASWSQRMPIPPRFQDICTDGTTVRLKFCSTCQIFRPPRAFHCPICDNCVERFDHHCPWIGTCIGLRNYGLFTIFIWITGALCVFVFVYSLLLLFRVGAESDSSDFWTITNFVLKQQPIAVALVAFVFVVIWFPIGLIMFHIYLVVVNKTTNEELRGLHEFGSIYSIGLLGNIAHICCVMPKSNVHIHHQTITPTKEYEEIQKHIVCYVNNFDGPQIKDQGRIINLDQIMVNKRVL